MQSQQEVNYASSASTGYPESPLNLSTSNRFPPELPSPKSADDERISQTDQDRPSSSSEENVSVSSPSPPPQRRRIMGRTNWCRHCETMHTKLIRHMIKKHADVPEVQRYQLVTDPDPAVQRKKRKEMCRDIVNRSNRHYNEKVINSEVLGKPLPVKRSKKCEVTLLSHVLCPTCEGLINKKSFCSHARSCKLKVRQFAGAPSHSSKASFLRPALGPKYAQLETEIFPNMVKDEISYLAQTDALILHYGRRFLQTHKRTHQRYYVSSQMRTLANLLLRLKTADPTNVKTMADCVDPTNFDSLCDVVREWSGFDDKSGICSKGSVPRRLCKALKLCSKILWCEVIKDKQLTLEQISEVRTKHERFTALMESEWTMEVNSAADKSLRIHKMGKEPKNPLPEDIVTFFRVMTEKIDRLTRALNDGGEQGSYTGLVKACIAYLILFNGKRPGEVTEAKVNDYVSTLKTRTMCADDGQQEQISVFIITTCKNIVHVPIIVTSTARSAIDALLNHRERLQVKGDLLFGAIDGTAFKGDALINSFKAEMDLTKPKHVSANGFRHYLATVSQLEPQIKPYMHKFLGHTQKVHDDIYELPNIDVQLELIAPALIQRWYTNDSTSASANLPSLDRSSLPSTSKFAADSGDSSRSSFSATAAACCSLPCDDVQMESSSSESDVEENVQLTSTKPKRSSPRLKPVPIETQTRQYDEDYESGNASNDHDDNRSEDPDFNVDSPTITASVQNISNSFEIDSDMSDSSSPTVKSRKNRWTTPERKELYEGLPRTMLGIERARRGQIHSVWENSKYIRRHHSLQTTRIEVSKYCTGKKKVPSPIRKTILQRLNPAE